MTLQETLTIFEDEKAMVKHCLKTNKEHVSFLQLMIWRRRLNKLNNKIQYLRHLIKTQI